MVKLFLLRFQFVGLDCFFVNPLKITCYADLPEVDFFLPDEISFFSGGIGVILVAYYSGKLPDFFNLPEIQVGLFQSGYGKILNV